MDASVQHAIRSFVVRNFLFGDAADLNDDSSFLETGVIDSTGVLELVGFIESTFGIVVDDADLVPANLDSVNRAVRYVTRKQAEREPRLAG